MLKALFVCYGGGHADALIPVMKYLKEKGTIDVQAIGVNLAADKLKRAGIICKSLSDYLDVEAVEIGFPLARDRHNFLSKVSFADSIAYYGFTMSDLITEVGEQTAYDVLRTFDRRTMFPVRTMTRILKKENPDVVITTTMNRFEAATQYAAGNLGIPTVKVEDLVGKITRTYPDKIQVDTEEEKQKLLQRGFKESDVILRSELMNSPAVQYSKCVYEKQLKMRPRVTTVFCDYVKEQIARRGIPRECIYVTGQPAFDGHPDVLKNTDRGAFLSSLGISEGHRVITFMSQPTADREDVLRIFAETVRENICDDVQFLIKLHPNEDGKIQRLILQDYGITDVLIVKTVDVRALLAVSDLVITVSSTTGLEAAVMGKPLVYISLTEEDDVPYQAMGIGRRTKNAGELMSAIRAELSGDSFNKEKDKFQTDGRAAQRVGDLVEVLAKKELPTESRVVIIIQARMGSTRLPGKVMIEYAGKPQIQHVVDRMRYSRLASDIVVATSTNSENQVLREYLTANQIHWFEGSETNVLDRYVRAAEQYKADIIVRVTADNPLTCADSIDRMIESHLQTGADYTTMNGLPEGCSAEVVNAEVLRVLNESDNITETDREHVTIYIYQHEDRYKINYMEASDSVFAPNLRLTVDTKQDMDRMVDLYDHLYDGKYIQLEEAISYVLTRTDGIAD
ncbi:MAG: CDP-glycerol glycerophosphotransferase family protein [Clostridia bacterium]|nr:CDP-glycerol glycerophosphotransferase family protein [Clostridia bacterium]